METGSVLCAVRTEFLSFLQGKGLDPSPVRVRFVVNKVAFGQVSLRVLRFSVVSSINAPDSSNTVSPES